MNYEKKYNHLLENVRIFVRLTKNMAEIENVTERVKVFKLLETEDFFKEMNKHTKE